MVMLLRRLGQRKLPLAILFWVIALSLFAITRLLIPQSDVQIIFVDQAAAGREDGRSWKNAYQDLQDAFDKVNHNPQTRYQIWVAAGTYFPDGDHYGERKGGDKQSSFYIQRGNLEIYGGFSGTESSLTARNWEIHHTILSGDIDSNDHSSGGKRLNLSWKDIQGENADHVISISCIDPDKNSSGILIDGLIITGGQADTSQGNLEGGGIYYKNGSDSSAPPCPVWFRNMLIGGNTANQGAGLYYQGSGPSLILENVTLTGNLALEDGGGIYLSSGNFHESAADVNLINSSFLNNISHQQGAGLFLDLNQTTGQYQITNGVFAGNISESGQGVITTRIRKSSGRLIFTNLTMLSAHPSGSASLQNLNSSDNFLVAIQNSILEHRLNPFGNVIYNDDLLPVISHSSLSGCGDSSETWDPGCGVDEGGNLNKPTTYADPDLRSLWRHALPWLIDSGENQFLPADRTDFDQDGNTSETLEFDRSGDQRIRSGQVDIGAYEYNSEAGSAKTADFDGDGDSDYSIFVPEKGIWYLQGQEPVYLGKPGDIAVPGDYDGDGTVDPAVYRPLEGRWLIFREGHISSIQYPGDVPVPGDYNGDGVTDLAVIDASGGTWHIQDQRSLKFFQTGDIPVPCDYDGDGITDIAVFRPGNGYWYREGMPSVWLGNEDDIPVPGDYDGDGQCEPAVWRASTGTWYIREGSQISSFWWGSHFDIPVPGDYDGDGTLDAAVLRPSSGFWYIKDPLSSRHFFVSGAFPVLARDYDADGDPW